MCQAESPLVCACVSYNHSRAERSQGRRVVLVESSTGQPLTCVLGCECNAAKPTLDLHCKVEKWPKSPWKAEATLACGDPGISESSSIIDRTQSSSCCHLSLCSDRLAAVIPVASYILKHHDSINSVGTHLPKGLPSRDRQGQKRCAKGTSRARAPTRSRAGIESREQETCAKALPCAVGEGKGYQGASQRAGEEGWPWDGRVGGCGTACGTRRGGGVDRGMRRRVDQSPELTRCRIFYSPSWRPI